MSSAWAEKLLEKLASEIDGGVEDEGILLYDYVLEHLQKLVPLLEAGQGMRDCNYINTTNSLRWDEAKQAALGEQNE